jgi:hypothetical protein
VAAGMAEGRGRRLKQLLAKDLSGKEIARLALQSHMEELAGKRPTFSEAEIERARATLRGRPHEAAVYNAWIEASRIVDYTTMEALVKALEAEKRLVVVTGMATPLFRHGSLQYARRVATKILTPAEWEAFPAAREKARRARMAEEKIALGAVKRGRAWWLAAEDLKARVRALPHFKEDERNAHACLVEVDDAAALKLDAAAEAEIVELVKAKKLRFVRDGKDVSARIRAGRHKGSDAERKAFEAEAACSLLELVEAGLPEWQERGRAAWLTPLEFRGPVAVLQEIPPGCLDGEGRFVEPGWKRIEEQFQHEAEPEKLERIGSTVKACEAFIRAFLARKAIIEVFSQELGLDLFIPLVREREEVLRDMVALYNRLAEMSREGEPDEDGFVPPGWLLPLPRDLRLPPIDPEELKPDPDEVELMRQRLATPLGEAWWEAAFELGVCGALGDWQPELKERLRRRGQELGSINLACEELMTRGFGVGEGG